MNEDKWRGETVLQSTFSSKLLNLGHTCTLPSGTTTASQQAPLFRCVQLTCGSLSLSLATHHVDAHSLSSLCAFIKERRPLLVSLPRQPPQDLNRLPYVSLRTLRVNTLVHALLRITHTHFSSGEWAWLIYCIS